MLLCLTWKWLIFPDKRQESWQTEALIRANAFSTTRWRWGGCYHCWGPLRRPALTTSASRTVCLDLDKAMPVSKMRSTWNNIKWYYHCSSGSDNFMMMMIGWMLMAAMMYFLRPNSMRNNSTEGKPQGRHIKMMNQALRMWLNQWLFQVQEAVARDLETPLHLWARSQS